MGDEPGPKAKLTTAPLFTLPSQVKFPELPTNSAWLDHLGVQWDGLHLDDRQAPAAAATNQVDSTNYICILARLGGFDPSENYFFCASA
jgi:hypothetical protein